MVASREVEIPNWRAVGRQRGRGFGALVQVVGRTTIPFLCKYIVPAAKRVGADLLEFAVPEVAEVVNGIKNFKTATKSVRKQTLEKNIWVKGAGKRLQAESFQQNLLNNPVGCGETFLKTFLVDDVKQQLSVPTFCGSVWKSWRESPSSWRSLVITWTRNLSYYLTRWKLYRFWISNGSKLLRWFETDVLGFETKFCKGSWLGNLQYQRSEKGAQRRGKSRRRRDGGIGGGSSSSCYSCKQHFHSIFSNVEVYINNQQFYNSNGLFAHISYSSNNFKGAISEYKEVLHFKGYHYEEVPDKSLEAPLFETFFHEENEKA